MKQLFTILFSVFILSITLSFAQNVATTKTSMNSEYFIENKGQWDEQALFMSKHGNVNFWITKDGVTYDYYVIERDQEFVKPDGSPNMDHFGKTTKYYGHVIITKFLNANKTIKIEQNDKKEGIYNYLLGNDPNKWITEVPLFGNITLKNIYDNIDISYFFKDHKIRYDFIVHPNADPTKIRIKFDGQTTLAITPQGDLLVGTTVGDVIHSKLYAYQRTGTSEQKIECRFKIEEGNIVSFEVGNYDKNKELVIDPTFIFSSYFGGNNTDYPYAVGIDPQGRVIMTGYTYSTNLPVTSGAYQQSLSTTPDAYAVKFNATGTALTFFTYLGGNSSDYGYGIGSDSGGNVYVGGYTYSTNWPITSGAFQTILNTTPDLFVTKLNSTGTGLVYSTFIGGNNSDVPYGMDVKNGIAFLTGYTYSTNWPVTTGAFQTTMKGSQDVFVVAVNTTGTGLVFSTYLGGSNGYEYGYGIAADNNNNAYVTGYTYSSDFPTTSGVYGPTYSYYDPFVTKINANGSIGYSTFIPTASYSDYAYGIGVDGSGCASITGYTSAPTWPIVNAYKTTPGGTDGFLLKLNQTGSSIVFSTFIGGASTDYGRDVVCDAADNVYVAGYTNSTDMYVSPDRQQGTNGGGYDAFLMQFGPNGGTPLYSTYLGGSSTDYAYYFQCIGVSDNNEIGLGGYTASTNFPCSSGAFQTAMQTSPDCWAAKFQFDPPAKLTMGNVTPSGFCAGDAITVTFTLTGQVKSDNQFIVEMSDENGSFASPRQIGSISSVTAQPIVCTTPANLMPVTGYKVRVRSTNPATTSDESKALTVYPKPVAQKILGDGGFCSFDPKGAEIKLEKTEKFYLYQLYRDGVKVGNPVVGEGGEISFGFTKATGKYTVEGISPYGCKNWMSGEITVREIPSPKAFNITGGGPFYNQPGPGTYCEGGDGVAIGLSGSELGVKYQLRLDGKNINVPINGTGEPLSFGMVTQPGTYTVYAETILGGCPNNMNGSIKVSILPAPKEFKLLGESYLCEGSSGNEFKLDGSESGITYQLLFNGKKVGTPIAGTGNEISFGKFKDLGKYEVLATNITTGCTKIFNSSIELKSIPLPRKYQVQADKYFCDGSQGVEFFLSGSEKDVAYQLMLGSTAVGSPVMGNGGKISLGYANTSGTYTVIGTTINGGCATTMMNAVSIQSLPAPNSIIKGNDKPQINSLEKYWVEDTQEGDSYLWKVTDGTITTENGKAEIMVQWTDKKKGVVEVYRENIAGCKSEGRLDVTLTNNLVPDFTSSTTKGDAPLNVSFTNKSTGYITYYNWDFGDGESSPLANPNHTYKVPGKYTVTLTIGYQDVRVTKTMQDFITVFPFGAVKSELPESNNLFTIMSLDPNPANNSIRLVYNATTEHNSTFAIYDIMGNKILEVFNGYVLSGTHELNIDLTKLPSGNYILEIANKEGKLAKFFNIVR